MTRRRPDRIVGVDAARGVALLGMVAVHVLPADDPDGSVSLAYQVASGRSAALFAVLAGVAVALAFGPRPSLPRAGGALLVRAVLIGAIGLALGQLGSGVAVILAYYAVFFVLLVPWLRAAPRVLLPAALAVAVVVPLVSLAVRDDLPERDTASPELSDLADPGQLLSELLLTGYYPALAWLAYLLVGLAVGRWLARGPRVAVTLVAAGVALAVGATAISAVLLGPLDGYAEIAAAEGIPSDEVERVVDASRFGNVPTTTPWWLATDAPHSSTPLDLLATTGTALLVLGLALLVTRRAGPLLAPLVAAGSMPLTLYSVHVAVLAVTDTDEPVRYYLTQVVVGLVAAVLWRRYVGRGPLEAAVALASRPLRGRRT